MPEKDACRFDLMKQRGSTKFKTKGKMKEKEKEKKNLYTCTYIHVYILYQGIYI